MKLIGIAAVGLLLLLTSSLARAETTPFVIEATGVTHDQHGGCKVALALSNNYTKTLEVSGSAVLLNLEGTALGDGHVSFPPSLPGKKSLAEVQFFSSDIAGGRCPTEFDVNLTTEFCFVTGASSELTAEFCKTTFSYTIRKRT